MYKVVTNGLSKDCDIDELSTEIMAYSKFIIKFLKSDKHLFMV